MVGLLFIINRWEHKKEGMDDKEDTYNRAITMMDTSLIMSDIS